MQVRISVANGDLTRAANDEIGDGNETGIPDEYLVNKATLYFFESNLLAMAPMEFTGFQKEAAVTDNKVVWVSQNRKMEEGTYEVVIIVNGAAAVPPAIGTTTLADFLKDVKSGATTWLASASSGLLMASRDASNAYVSGVTVTTANTPANPALVAAEVERTVAKIMLADGQTTPNNYSYSVAGQFVRNTSTAATVSIALSDYRMLNLRNEFFTFRHATTGFTPVNPGETVDPVTYTFGNLAGTTSYIMDPRTYQKNTSMPVAVGGVTYTDWYVNNGFSAVGDAAEHILGYCQENTMEKAAQKKGYGTAIVFKGKITVDGVTIASGDNLYYDRTNKVFYGSYTDLKAGVSGLDATVNYTQLAANNIDTYKDGYCTYVYYIKHADNSAANDMGIMEYAMVRNNVYKVAVTGIDAPGKGLVPNPLDPSNPLDPANPTNPTDKDPSVDPAEDIETEDISIALKVKLTIKPWIIRNNNVILK
ncbi:Mfa1 family fimbria major subunit, partial [uncultured Proteiniphilum sp.]|uniref:Mfa1 family fimbria major subunit n=1 Tax=uncultured Proteiniphilum sp. TaxID=497637 RepID=UPI00262FF698